MCLSSLNRSAFLESSEVKSSHRLISSTLLSSLLLLSSLQSLLIIYFLLLPYQNWSYLFHSTKFNSILFYYFWSYLFNSTQFNSDLLFLILHLSSLTSSARIATKGAPPSAPSNASLRSVEFSVSSELWGEDGKQLCKRCQIRE